MHLGIPLSPANARLRIPLTLAACAVWDIQAPLPLQRAIPAAPRGWRPALNRLARAGQTHGITFRVYGSLAWQYLTGEAYVTPSSDVDLLFYPADDQQLRRGLQLLQDWEHDTGLRADGECISAAGAAVAWRELLGTGDRLLTKTNSSAQLTPRSEFLRAFASEELFN